MAEIYEFRLIISGPGITQSFRLPVGITIIGREQGSHLPLANQQVSRQHAQIECSTTECVVTDLRSSNGTFLNGERLEPLVPVILSPQTILTIGPYHLVLEQTRVSDQEVQEQTPSFELAVEAAPATPAPESPFLDEPAPAGDVPQRDDQRGEPPPPASPAPGPAATAPAGAAGPPPGLSPESRRLLNYLPGIYHTDFMANFLRIFESILFPIEWTIDNFDLFLDPGTAPAEFLPWLANCFQIAWGPGWSEPQRRLFLKEAHQIFSRRGTSWALSRILEIYTGRVPEIIDLAEDLKPFTFRLKLPLNRKDVDPSQIEALIVANKPAFTTYVLEFEAK